MPRNEMARLPGREATTTVSGTLLTSLRARTSAPRSSDAGAAAVEFAILLPLFLMLVFGLLTGGIAFERWINVTQAARESSRFAATYPGSNTNWYTEVLQVAKDNADITASTPQADYYVCVSFRAGNEVPTPSTLFPASNISVSGTLSPGSFTPSTANGCLSTSQVGAHIEVLIRRKASLNWILGGGDLAVAGTNTSRYEGPRSSS